MVIVHSPGALKDLNMDTGQQQTTRGGPTSDGCSCEQASEGLPLRYALLDAESDEEDPQVCFGKGRELSISPGHQSLSVFHENQTRDVFTKLFPQVDLTKHPKIT